MAKTRSLAPLSKEAGKKQRQKVAALKETRAGGKRVKKNK